MTGVRETVDGLGGVVLRDARVAFSYRLRFAGHLLSACFSLTIFYYVSRLVVVEPFGAPDAYFAFAVIGLIALQVLNSTLATPPGAARQELVAGTFEVAATSPYGIVGTLLASLVFPFLYTLAIAAGMLVFAALAFDLALEPTAPLGLPVAVLAGLAFAPFGVALLAAMLVAKQALAGTTFVVAAITLVAGLYFPVELLPEWLRWASEVQPFTPAVELLRHLLVGSPLEDPWWAGVLRIAAFAAVLLPLSVALLAAAVRFAVRRGTLIEY